MLTSEPNPPPAGPETPASPIALGLSPALDNPCLHPHSATRFVLPFNVFRNRASGGQSTATSASPHAPPSYRLATQNDWILANKDARFNYLTAETRKVVFERAKWLVMDCAPREITMVTPDDRRMNGVVQPPALILFEELDPQAPTAESHHGPEVLSCGFLVIEVGFCGDSTGTLPIDDILLFNNLFRHWKEPFETHRERYKKQIQGFGQLFLEMTGTALADSSARTKGSDFDPYGDGWMALLRVPLPDGGTPLAGFSSTPAELFGGYPDGRAFVWTRVLLREGSDVELIVPGHGKGDKWEADVCPTTGFRPMFGYWVKLLNADQPVLVDTDEIPSGYGSGEKTNQTTAFERAWAEERTYRRWEHCNCYYGFNYFGGAMMAAPQKNSPIWRHWFEMYFDQILLLLYLRVTLFRFSSELARNSESLARHATASEDNTQTWRLNFRNLRKAFTCFENLYQFPLLSNQQQAVEMYVRARKGMDVDDLYAEIDREIRSSDELLESEVEERRSELATALNHLATFGFGVSAGLSTVQLSVFSDWVKSEMPGQACPMVQTIIALIFVSLLWCFVFQLGLSTIQEIQKKRK